MHAATKSALICSHGSLISHVQAVTLRKHNIGKLGAISFCLWCYKYIPFLFCVCFDWTWLCGDSQAISRLMSLPRLFVGRWSIFMHVVQSYSVINENMFAFECHSSDSIPITCGEKWCTDPLKHLHFTLQCSYYWLPTQTSCVVRDVQWTYNAQLLISFSMIYNSV